MQSFDGTHRKMASRAAQDVLMTHRDEWLRGLNREQAQDAVEVWAEVAGEIALVRKS